MRRTLPLIALALTVPAAAQNGGPPPFVIAETGKGYATIGDAVTAARDDTVTILIAPGVYRQCTVQTGGLITYKARQPGTVVFDGTTCEGKAAFVLRGRGSIVDGIVFRNLRVDDGNGAGIRIETGDLTVSNAMFLDSQEGILGGGHETVRHIRIDRSTFSGLGQCAETVDCSHSIYLGFDGELTVTRSRFEQGTGGHYVKARAAHVRIENNSFDDSRGDKTNYMIDLSEGGTGTIAGNTFVQGTHKENWTAFITIGAEKRTYSSDGLTIRDNVATLAPGMTKSPAFVADYTGARIVMENNRLGEGVRPFEKR